MQECSVLNECMVLLLPTAVYAICAGCSPLMKYFKNSSISHPYLDVSETGDDWVQVSNDVYLFYLRFSCIHVSLKKRTLFITYSCRWVIINTESSLNTLDALLKYLLINVRVLILRCWMLLLQITFTVKVYRLC